MQFAISAVGRDRPGIVAALTGVIVAHGANVADAHMSVLSGRFTMMVIADGPDDTDEAALLGDLLDVGRDFGLDVVSANRIDRLTGPAVPEPTHLVTVSGVDSAGLVHAVTSQLARHGVNVTDLQTRLLQDPGDEPLYAMMLEVVPHRPTDLEELERALQAVAGERGVSLSLRPIPDE